MVPPAPPGLVLPEACTPRDRTQRRSRRGLEEGRLADRKQTAAAQGAWIVFEDEVGHNPRPPTARTWSPRGTIPVIAVNQAGSGRIAVAGLVAYRPGHEPRMMFRTRDQTRTKARRPRRRGFDWTDYRDLLRAAHAALDAPIVLVWNNLNSHKSVAMRRFIEDSDWLTVVHLPAYAPDLNPVEGLWSLVKRGELANLAVTGIDHLARTVRRSLRRLQRRPTVLEGLLAQTGLQLIEQEHTVITN
ncbi:hypothetical protein GCM10009799_33690 [Nocardiopsis rhodophaea]|uniref:Tc1-like transposase DDE domain-containing protein n=1 Tax=Nocardiopsis rhodophaea TaxID=280238 RepID=A0ABP5ERY9_9ACTN